MITSWICPNRFWVSLIAKRESTRSGQVSPMPIRIPVVKGMCNFPAPSRVRIRRDGILSGPSHGDRRLRSDERSNSEAVQPEAHVDLPERLQITIFHDTRIGVGKKGCLLNHQTAHGFQVVEGPLKTELVQSLPGLGIPNLRFIPQMKRASLQPCFSPSFANSRTSSGVKNRASGSLPSLRKVQ